ncbi:MAG TPA: hypothetical protein PK813_05120, partial [Candidatus Hydrogenedens sp.]|nr:hypothetical protein [Candidatus Hydrogenedens sp.]
LENTQKEGEHRKEGEEGEEEEVFFLSGDTSFSLTENQIATIKVQFIPLKEKEYTAKVKVVASDNQNAEINIRGIGKKKPKAFYFFGCGDAPSKNHIDKVDFLCLFILLCILLRFNYRKKGISLTK